MKLKFNWIPFILSFITIFSLRMYQILSVGNAYIRMQWDNIEMICFTTALVASIIIVAMSYLSKDVSDDFVLNKNVLSGAISILTSAVIAWNSFYKINSYLINNNDDNSWINLVSSILGFLACIAFILIGFNFFYAKNYFENYRLLTLVPTLWVLSELLNLFFKYNSIPTDITNVSNALAKIFLLFFLFAQARLFAGLFSSITLKKLFYFGFSAILFITVSLSNYIATSMDNRDELNLKVIALIILEIILVIYILSILLTTKTKEIQLTEKNVSINSTQERVNDNNEDVKKNECEGSIKSDMSEVDRLIEDIENEKKLKTQDTSEINPS